MSLYVIWWNMVGFGEAPRNASDCCCTGSRGKENAWLLNINGDQALDTTLDSRVKQWVLIGLHQKGIHSMWMQTTS